MPGAAIPSTQKGNDIRADVILAEEFEGQIGRWRAFMTERVDALFPRYHRPWIILHVSRQVCGPARHHHRGYHVIQHVRTGNGSFICSFNRAAAARQVWLNCRSCNAGPATMASCISDYPCGADAEMQQFGISSGRGRAIGGRSLICLTNINELFCVLNDQNSLLVGRCPPATVAPPFSC